MDAAPAGGLGEAGVAELRQQLARHARHAHRVVEVGAGLGVEVEPQLVGVVGVLAPHRPRMERDRAHVRAPGHDRYLGRADLVGVAAGRELDPAGLEVVGRALGDALLEERVAAAPLTRGQHDALVDALRPALERRRPAAKRAHDARPRPRRSTPRIELRESRVRSVAGKITRSGLETRTSRPPASIIVPRWWPCPKVLRHRRTPPSRVGRVMYLPGAIKRPTAGPRESSITRQSAPNRASASTLCARRGSPRPPGAARRRRRLPVAPAQRTSMPKLSPSTGQIVSRSGRVGPRAAPMFR